MKILLVILALFGINSSLYSANKEPLLNQSNQFQQSTSASTSHSRSSSIQSINNSRSTEEINSLQTTVHMLNNSSRTGYTTINIPEDETILTRSEHELLENKTKQLKLCSALSAGVGLIYLLIRIIEKHT